MRTQLRYDFSKPLSVGLNGLIDEAAAREARQSDWVTTALVLRHLIAATIVVTNLATEPTDGPVIWDLHRASSAAALRMGEAAIYCSCCPATYVMLASLWDIRCGMRPVVATYGKGLAVAELYAEKFGIAGELDTLDVPQFVAGRLHVASQFDFQRRQDLLRKLVRAYNARVTAAKDPNPLRMRVFASHLGRHAS